MINFNLFLFIPKLLWRDWRAGELHILVFAIVVAVTSIVAIGFFSAQLELNMQGQVSRLLGAPFIVRSMNHPLEARWLLQAEQQQLTISQSLVFASVLSTEQQLHLSDVKAIDDNYVKQIDIRIAPDFDQVAIKTQSPPKSGTIWLEERLFYLLQANIGDKVELGYRELEIAGVFVYESRQSRSWWMISPKAFINRKDVASTKIIQPGSRVTYDYLFYGDKSNIELFRQWLQPQLSSSQWILTEKNIPRALNSALQKARDYLLLASLISVILAGVAIAIASQHFSRLRWDQTAVFRCFAYRKRDVLVSYIAYFLLLSVISSSIACGLGWLLHWVWLIWFKDFLLTFALIPSWKPIVVGIGSGIVVLFGFSLPVILQLASVPPLRVLRSHLMPLSISAIGLWLSAIVTVFILLWWYSQHFLLVFLLFVLGFGLLLLLLAMSSIGLISLKAIVNLSSGSFHWALLRILRQLSWSLAQVLALSLVFMLVGLAWFVKLDLFQGWQQQLPSNTPNYFLINIQPFQIEQVKQFVATSQINATDFYPMIRGRLIELNGQAIKDAIPAKAKNHNVLRRELNLSWASKVPEHNSLVQGKWWSDDISEHWVSVEYKLAKTLGIELGDRLSFRVGSEVITATVKNFRQVKWDSFYPNFYMILSPRILDQSSITWINSFYLPPKKQLLLKQLSKQFPNITIISIDAIVHEVRQILQRMLLAVDYLLLFVLAASFTVLFATLQASLAQRRTEMKIFHLLGCQQSQLQRQLWWEFLILGIFSGILAMLVTEAVIYGLYTWVLHWAFHWHPWLLVLPVLTVMSLMLGVRGMNRKVLSAP